MPVIERDIVMEGRDANGNRTVDLPITRLGNIEDTAEIKEMPGAGDFIPVIDAADDFQMKKMPAGILGSAAAPLYSETSTYDVGAYCSVGGKLYRCTTNINTPEAWTPAHWEETTIPLDLRKVAEAVTGGDALAYSSTKEYAVGDLCNHGGKLYKCVSAIPAGEAWTPAHWEETTVAEQVDDAAKGGAASMFGFEIGEDGHLYMAYRDGATPPDAEIGNDGHLYVTL